MARSQQELFSYSKWLFLPSAWPGMSIKIYPGLSKLRKITSLDWNGYVVIFAALVISCTDTWARCGKSIGIMLQGPKWNMFETTRILARNFCFWSFRPILWPAANLLKGSTRNLKIIPFVAEGNIILFQTYGILWLPNHGFVSVLTFHNFFFPLKNRLRKTNRHLCSGSRCSISAWLTVSRKASRQPQRSGSFFWITWKESWKQTWSTWSIHSWT